MLTNSTLLDANSGRSLRVRVHPVVLVTSKYPCQVRSNVVFAVGGEAQGVSRVGVKCCYGIAHDDAQACRCRDKHASSTQGVCKRCGSVSLATWSMKTCGSECWQAWSSCIKLQWNLRWFQLKCVVLDDGGCAALWCKANGWVQPGGPKILQKQSWRCSMDVLVALLACVGSHAEGPSRG